MGFIRNGAIEQQLRRHLTSRGLNGRSAKFESVELSAIEPPGWVQTFRFQVRVFRTEGEWTRFSGTCRDDERHSSFQVTMREIPPTPDDEVIAGSDSTASPENRPAGSAAPWGSLVYFVAAAVIVAAGLLTRLTW